MIVAFEKMFILFANIIFFLLYNCQHVQAALLTYKKSSFDWQKKEGIKGQLDGKKLRKINKKLFRAVNNSDEKKVELLLDEGADPNIPNQGRLSHLIQAAYNGFEGVMLALIVGGADVNIQDQVGMTCLHIAACHHHKQMIKILLAAEASLAIKDAWGKTAWFYANDKIKQLIYNTKAKVKALRKAAPKFSCNKDRRNYFLKQILHRNETE